MVTALARTSYARLLEEARRIHREGRDRAEWAVEYEKVRTYLQRGRLVKVR